ncbi:MAG TPA: polysaccharide biosynthesis/export family protein [Bacteroidales bacterium]|nr:polysaccharide biosynthesis/export family protein [Bacteroidales bacterium]
MLLLAIGVITSCIPQKQLLLMQYEKLIDSTYAKTFEGKHFEDTIYRIQPNDYLYISILTVEKPLTQVVEPLAGLNYLNLENQALIGFHVYNDGTIYYPYIGPVKLGGLTIREARDTLRTHITKLVGRCRIEMVLINNTVYFLGEFNKQGVYNMTRNQLGIYEAITLAGGLTDYAKRNKIKVLRTENGVRKLYLVDVTSGNQIGKNMFYIYPNDVIYAEPMKAKAIGITPTFSLTVLTTIVTFTLLIYTFFK